MFVASINSEILYSRAKEPIPRKAIAIPIQKKVMLLYTSI